jgi:hypothetical protein
MANLAPDQFRCDPLREAGFSSWLQGMIWIKERQSRRAYQFFS